MDSSKSPFDSSNFSGPRESSTNESTSATGMFGKITPQSTPPPEQDDLLQSLLRADTAPPKSSLPEAPSQLPPQAQPSAAPQPSGMGSFTQMFQALKSTEPQAAKAEYQPVHEEPQPPLPLRQFSRAAAAWNRRASLACLHQQARRRSSIPCGTQARQFTQLLQTLNNRLSNTPCSASSA